MVCRGFAKAMPRQIPVTNHQSSSGAAVAPVAHRRRGGRSRMKAHSSIGERRCRGGKRPMMRRLTGRLGLGTLVLALLLAAVSHAGLLAPRAAAAQATTPVRIGTLGILADAPVYIAADRGYFAEQGLAPTLERFDTGAQM